MPTIYQRVSARSLLHWCGWSVGIISGCLAIYQFSTMDDSSQISSEIRAARETLDENKKELTSIKEKFNVLYDEISSIKSQTEEKIKPFDFERRINDLTNLENELSLKLQSFNQDLMRRGNLSALLQMHVLSDEFSQEAKFNLLSQIRDIERDSATLFSEKDIVETKRDLVLREIESLKSLIH